MYVLGQPKMIFGLSPMLQKNNSTKLIDAIFNLIISLLLNTHDSYRWYENRK